MKLCLATAAAIVFSAPALAAGILDPMLGDPGGCYARAYDQAHLSSHPRQRVEYISLGYSDWQEPGYDITLDLSFTLRDGSVYSGLAYCREDLCALEGDGGYFNLLPRNDGLELSVVRYLELEGYNSFSGNLMNSDDQVFLIYPARPAACFRD
ncbi:hypothetical protein [Devosia rhizoryzae]|uniref:Uncharacterized protein n=1 Tax=Devosia rhizoryzae TaxID=2774137 RepID=A0ABX7C5A9_9HYPH|nr:hypothetical protein [Devosia rhizoryzae]QQR39427.1 hypothetical protein JI748_17205 [Devosia rhizoryzae]